MRCSLCGISGKVANGNTVAVTFTTAAVFPDIRIAEYSGLDTVNPFDGSSASQGNNSGADSRPETITASNDLLVSAPPSGDLDLVWCANNGCSDLPNNYTQDVAFYTQQVLLDIAGEPSPVRATAPVRPGFVAVGE